MNQQPVENDTSQIPFVQSCDFGRSCAVLLPIERGQAKDDNGAGAVNWGITQRFLNLIGDSRTPGHLSWDDAKALYKEHYWKPWRLGDVYGSQQAVVDYLFGMLVNTNPQQVVMRVQMAVNGAGNKTIKIDGKIGPVTLAALDSCDVKQFKWNFYHFMQTWYQELGQHPRHEKQLGGWLNRNIWFYLHSGKDPAQVPDVFDPKSFADFQPEPVNLTHEQFVKMQSVLGQDAK